VVVAASTEALANHFSVSANRVNVTATEVGRRLRSDARRLAGNWAIGFQFYAPASKAAAVTAKVDSASSDQAAFKTTFTTVFKTALSNAGAPKSAIDAVQVSSISVVVVLPPGAVTSTMTTTMAPVERSTSGAFKTALSMVVMVIAAIKMML